MAENFEKIIGLIEKASELKPLARRSFKKSEYLIHQNEKSRHMFVIHSGKARIFRQQSGFMIHLDDVGPGEVVGELSLIDGGPRSASCVALEEVEVLVVTPNDYDELQQRLPTWFGALARSIVHRLRNVINSLEREPDTYLQNSLVSLLIFKTLEKDNNQQFDRAEINKEFSEILRVEERQITDHLNRMALGSYIKLTSDSVTIPSLKVLEKLQLQLQEKTSQDRWENLKP